MAAKLSNNPAYVVYDRSFLGTLSIENGLNPTLDTITYTGTPSMFKDKNISTGYIVRGTATGGNTVNFTIMIDYGKTYYSCQTGLIIQGDKSGGAGDMEVRVSPTDMAQPNATIVGNYSPDFQNKYIAAIVPTARYIYITCTGDAVNGWVEVNLRELLLTGSD